LDLTIEVPPVPPDVLGGGGEGESSGVVRARVVAARARQRERYGPDGPRTNAELTPSMLARHCYLDRAAARLLTRAVEKLALSARAYDRVRKIARTIADLCGSETVHTDHIAEAIQFRVSV
jgi:magnesium chelatase family protein